MGDRCENCSSEMLDKQELICSDCEDELMDDIGIYVPSNIQEDLKKFIRKYTANEEPMGIEITTGIDTFNKIKEDLDIKMDISGVSFHTDTGSGYSKVIIKINNNIF